METTVKYNKMIICNDWAIQNYPLKLGHNLTKQSAGTYRLYFIKAPNSND